MFADAVRRVADGGSVLNRDAVARLVSRSRRASPLDEPTPRERQVLSLIAEGRSNADTGHELVITMGAVERHVTGIFDKLLLHKSPEGASPSPRRAHLPAVLTGTRSGA